MIRQSYLTTTTIFHNFKSAKDNALFLIGLLPALPAPPCLDTAAVLPTVSAHAAPDNDGQWLFSDITGLEVSLELPSIGCTLSLSDVYNKVMFEAE
jgi:hypothetical protein